MNYPYKERPAHSPKHFIFEYFPQWMEFTRNEDDPLHKFIDLALHHDAELAVEYLDKINKNTFIETVDISEPWRVTEYQLKVDGEYVHDEVLSGIIDGTAVEIYRCKTPEEFLSKIPTRVIDSSIPSGFPSVNIVPPSGATDILYAVEGSFRKEYTFFLVSGMYLYKYTLDRQRTSDTTYTLSITDLSISDLSTRTMVEKLPLSGLQLELSYEPISGLVLYDYKFLDLNNNPIEVSSDEYTVSGTTIYLNPPPRPSYVPNYYTSSIISGQPDIGWNGAYMASYDYRVFESGISLSFRDKLHEFHSLTENELPVLSIKDSTQSDITVNYDYAETSYDTDDTTRKIMLRVDQDELRPGTVVDIHGETFIIYTKTYSTQVTSGVIDIPALSGMINDEGITYDNIVLKQNNISINNIIDMESCATIIDNGDTSYTISVDVTSEDTSFNAIIVARKVSFDITTTTYASYSINGVFAKDDFKVEDNTLIPYTMITICRDDVSDPLYSIFDTLWRDKKNHKEIYSVTTPVQWDSIEFDSYYGKYWHLDTNSNVLYLKAIDGTVEKIVYIDTPTDTVRYDMSDFGYEYEIPLTSLERYDDTTIIYDILSYGDFLYMLYYVSGIIYINQLNKFNIETEIGHADFSYTIYEESVTNAPTVAKMTIIPEDTILLMIDGEVKPLFMRYDYFAVDDVANKIITREHYDSIWSDNLTPAHIDNMTQINRFTSLDRLALPLSLERLELEPLVMFYERTDQFKYEWNINQYGTNNTLQGIINDIAIQEDVQHYNSIDRHIYYLSNIPISKPLEDSSDTTDIRLFYKEPNSDTWIERLDRIQEYYNTPELWKDLGLPSYYDMNGNSTALSGWLVWRNKDGTYSNILEIIDLPPNGSQLKVVYWIKIAIGNEIVYHKYEDVIDLDLENNKRLTVYKKTDPVDFRVIPLSDNEFYLANINNGEITDLMRRIIEKQETETSMLYKYVTWDNSMWIDEDIRLYTIIKLEDDT